MRFDTPIYFQCVTPGPYDATTGDYAAETVEEVMRMASVTSTGTQTLQLIFGTLKEGCLTVRLQNRYDEPFDRIRIGGKVYRVDMARPLRVKETFVVSEVQG